MPGALGPRFALEAGFLILLAAVAAYARLSAAEIMLLMAGGWLLASIFEVLASRRERLYPGWGQREPGKSATQPEGPEAERRVGQERSWLRAPGESASNGEIAPEDEQAIPAQTDEADTGEFPLPPRRRRWLGLKRPSKSQGSILDSEGERPSSRHVRLITGQESAGGESERPKPEPEAKEDESRKDAEAGP